MRFSALALTIAAGLLLTTTAAIAQCPPGTEYVPAGYGKKAKWVQAKCAPVYQPARPPTRAQMGAERATTRQLNRDELARAHTR